MNEFTLEELAFLQSLVLDYSAPVKASQVFVLLAQKIAI
jgi:hypothetical protein